ncbi:hypothetical protein ACH4RA_15950 [Streptomyces smyrnaeus]|uniref:hypothetical protein n=1 Tax=Streptomyces smyrnaeus TaxID=1387713 RepID=UPI0037993254
MITMDIIRAEGMSDMPIDPNPSADRICAAFVLLTARMANDKQTAELIMNRWNEDLVDGLVAVGIYLAHEVHASLVDTLRRESWTPEKPLVGQGREHRASGRALLLKQLIRPSVPATTRR